LGMLSCIRLDQKLLPKKDLLWVMARYLSSYLEQELPGMAGFRSVLGDEPPRLTILDYYPVINQPITDNKASYVNKII
jgi:hypothetical protein